jgi:hypothetical protein
MEDNHAAGKLVVLPSPDVARNRDLTSVNDS